MNRNSDAVRVRRRLIVAELLALVLIFTLAVILSPGSRPPSPARPAPQAVVPSPPEVEEPPVPTDPDLPPEPRAQRPDAPVTVTRAPARIYTQELIRRDGVNAYPASAGTPRPVDVPRERISGFRESRSDLHPILTGFRPYESGRVRPVPFGLVDDEGVRVTAGADVSSPRIVQEGPFDHPIAQAQYALAAIESHRLTGEGHYLDVAEANARRMVERHHEIDGAWYFPYDFDFDLYRNDRGVLRAPWASGMASGQALSTFVRLHEATGEPNWREAADRTFAAFLQAPDGQGYFSSFVDDEGRLWLEEYSRYPVTDSERVLNGQMWSMFGLWDYWAMYEYDHPDAESLFRGALLTVEETAPTFFRQEGGPSLYSMWQGMPAHTYHVYHQHQFLMLYRMTQDPFWVNLASAYRDDWPEFRASGLAVLTDGIVTAYRLDDDEAHVSERTMEVLDTRKVTADDRADSTFDRRGQIPGGPRVLRLSSGPLDGWWVEEGADLAWSPEPLDLHSYLPEAVLRAAQDTVAKIRPDATTQDGAEELALEAGQVVRVDLSGYVHGEIAFRLAEGEHAGWWVRRQPGLDLHGA